MDRTARRDPKNRDHMMQVTEIAVALAPNFQLTGYFADSGAPKFTSLNVSNPDFFKAVNQIGSTSLDDWKTYLRWRALDTYAPTLPKAFVDEDFQFNGAYMSGQKEIERAGNAASAPRICTSAWRWASSMSTRPLVQEGKERTLKMVQAIEAAMHQDIGQLTWMSDTTKQKAYEKLNAIVNNIGYPDKWRDYSTVVVMRDDYAGNVTRASAFEVQRQRNKIGKPTDKKDWEMTPPTVNAYYRAEHERHQLPRRHPSASVLRQGYG
jgi:putative endopeptidase